VCVCEFLSINCCVCFRVCVCVCVCVCSCVSAGSSESRLGSFTYVCGHT